MLLVFWLEMGVASREEVVGGTDEVGVAVLDWEAATAATREERRFKFERSSTLPIN